MTKLTRRFTVRHPNVRDGLQAFLTHTAFRALRMAMASWLIFAITIISSGVYVLFHAQEALAVNNFTLKTGYYVGNGTTQSVTGLGFTPDMVIVKSSTAAGGMILKTSAMPSIVTSPLAASTADGTGSEIVLDADGFTVSSALEVNTDAVRFSYIAIGGSDCSSSGTFCVGIYTGSSGSTQAITTGFQPDLVIVKTSAALAGSFQTSSMSANNAGLFINAANNGTGIYHQTLDATGFTVGTQNNLQGIRYYYAAFKNISTQLFVGQYTGNGTDNRDITGVGFEPDFVFVKPNSTSVGAFNITETWGDNSNFATATQNAINNIQDLIADGFQVGTAANVNSSGVVYYYFAFGGASDPSGSGSFYMQKGSYTGNGSSQTIDTSFAPDLVIIKGDVADYAVFAISAMPGKTEYLGVTTTGFTDGVTDMDETGFTVGANSTVNTNTITYEYTAYGNATSPLTGDGAADFFIGVYVGSGVARAIDHLGFAPSMVVTKNHSAATAANWTSSTMTAGTSEYFVATADITGGSAFATLDSTGFSLGTGSTVNQNNSVYPFFAFKEGSFFDVGSYTGTGVARNITGLGFNPGFVWVKRSTAVKGVHRSTSSTITGTNSQNFINTANESGFITGFVSDGFSVGTDTTVNASAGAYQYAAWKSSTSLSAPSTPTNSSPANAATAQDLNVTLTGSSYSDSDGDAQVAATWQVDDDSDFASPVWTRTGGAESSTSVTSGNGTFANELSGKTELDHNTDYYWRVKYSDGVYSAWSTATSFTSNTIATPTASSPTSGETVTTLTPTLTASAFSDAQSGHTSAYAEWQISTDSSFATTNYDSGVTSYANSLAVPAATLSDKTVYYWRVKYEDSSSEWSSYSTAARFLVSQSLMTVSPLYSSSVVDQGDSVNIDAQVKLQNGAVINDATVTLDIYNPSGTKVVDAASMTYISGSSGVYRYAYTIPSTSGSYLYVVTATSSSLSGYGAANFEVRTISSDLTSVKSTVESEATAQTTERTAQDTERTAQDAERTAQAAERTAQDAERTAQAASRTTIDGIATDVDTVNQNLDVLLGAVVVTQSTVNDASATTTSFVTSLTNTTDDFYKNAVLTFTSGNLDGQTRRISGYNGTTKTITVDPALSAAPTNGSGFTIVKQNVYVEQQLAEHEAADASFRSDTTSRLTSIEGKIDTLTTTLNGVDTDLGSVQTAVNNVRSSQLLNYRASLSDVSEIQADSTYRAKLIVLDYESNPVDPVTTPAISIYDSTRTLVQNGVSMTKLSTGVYEYTYAVDADAVTGLWESIVNVDVGGSADILANDYWQVTGSPAQVVISSISDLTVPSIAAATTITNEGSGAFEYHYEWCVVASQSNQCGGDDDVYYGSAAKLINVGEDFNTTLTATVPSTGDYWFKVVVYYGTEASGASRSFTAVEESEVPEDGGGSDDHSNSSGGTSGTIPSRTPSTTDNTSLDANIYEEVLNARQDLALTAQKLSYALNIIGMMSPGVQTLLGVSTENTENLKEIQNKIADLRAVSSATRRIVEQKTVEPIVETYMKFNSVEIHFLITNPSDQAQTVKFKAFLPEEARPEHIQNADGLNVDYDTSSDVYYVSGDIPLGPRETIMKKVEMDDIWLYTDEEMQALKEQAAQLFPVLQRTQYEAQGAIYKNDIDSTLSTVKRRQEESYSSPQEHILAYRENKDRMVQVSRDLDQLKNLVVQAGASRGVVGQVGGIQTFATWGIILAIVFGFGLLAAVIFAMWRHQTLLAAAAMGIPPQEFEARLGQVKRRRKGPKRAAIKKKKK